MKKWMAISLLLFQILPCCTGKPCEHSHYCDGNDLMECYEYDDSFGSVDRELEKRCDAHGQVCLDDDDDMPANCYFFDRVCPAGKTGFCDGDVLYQCDRQSNIPTSSENCAASDTFCIDGEAHASCSSLPQACVDEVPYCKTTNNRVLMVCSGGIWYDRRCSSHFKCTTAKVGTIERGMCVLDAEKCETGYLSYCENSQYFFACDGSYDVIDCPYGCGEIETVESERVIFCAQ